MTIHDDTHVISRMEKIKQKKKELRTDEIWKNVIYSHVRFDDGLIKLSKSFLD